MRGIRIGDSTKIVALQKSTDPIIYARGLSVLIISSILFAIAAILSNSHLHIENN
jgi:hypothetical protein